MQKIIYVCDRCGIKYKKESTYDGKAYDSKVDFTSFGTFIEEREGQITPEKYKKYHQDIKFLCKPERKSSEQYDLCPSCANELKEWLSNSDSREDTYNDIYSDNI